MVELSLKSGLWACNLASFTPPTYDLIGQYTRPLDH